MLQDMMPVADYLTRMRDGTIKQINPFTGTEVWTVPGRGHRPLGNDTKPGSPVDPAKEGAHCAFCHGRVFRDAPGKGPSRARRCRVGDAQGSERRSDVRYRLGVPTGAKPVRDRFV